LVVPVRSIVVPIWAMYGSMASLTAGPGLTITPGSPVAAHSSNYVASEFGVIGTTSTNCSLGMSVSQDWGGTCFAFAAATQP
jgi:hypothetical protein